MLKFEKKIRRHKVNKHPIHTKLVTVILIKNLAMHHYLRCWYVYVCIRSYLKSFLRYTFSILVAFHPAALYFCKKWCDDTWSFIDAKKGSASRTFWETLHWRDNFAQQTQEASLRASPFCYCSMRHGRSKCKAPAIPQSRITPNPQGRVWTDTTIGHAPCLPYVALRVFQVEGNATKHCWYCCVLQPVVCLNDRSAASAKASRPQRAI